MALTARQRAKLPASAFIDRAHRRFPVPNAAQARKAGISKAQRARTHASALSRAAQSQPSRQAVGKGGRKVRVMTVTPSRARTAVRKAGGKVASASGRQQARRAGRGRTGRR